MRIHIKLIVTHKYFDYVILLVITLSSIHLALDNPLIDPKGLYAKILLLVDTIITAIFILEVILKMLAFGIISNGPQSYFRSYWNIMDFIIVIISVIYTLNFARYFPYC